MLERLLRRLLLQLLLVLLIGEHLREVNRKENWALRTVVWSEDLAIFDIHTRIVMLGCLQQASRPPSVTSAVAPRDGERVRVLASLLVEVMMRHSKELVLFGRIALELTQDLIVSLSSHYDLAVDVLNVHVFPTVGICSHQTSALIRDGTTDGCRLRRVLAQRRRGHVSTIQRSLLLHAVD